MNLVERINKDKRLKLLLFLILLVTVVLFMKIFYEYYVYSKNSELEETKVVLNDEKSVEIINYSDVLKLDNGKLDSNNNKISLSAEYNNSANYNVYVKVNNSVSNLVLKVIDNKGTSNIIDLSNKSGLYLVKSDCTINNSKDEWTFEVSGDTTNVDIDVILREDKVKISDYIKELSNNNLYYLDSDNTYRYVGSNPNNYISINNELYRIIGVFDDRLKVIKSDYATSDMLGLDGAYFASYQIGDTYYKGSIYDDVSTYYWNNESKVNNWEESNLNKINLNVNFRNYLGSSISLVDGDIILMDINDYYYSSYPEFWGKDNYLNGISTNYLYMGLDEWTISKVEGTSNYVYFIFSNGKVNDSSSYGKVDNISAVRPVFYLKSDCVFISGNGSITEPFIVSI